MTENIESTEKMDEVKKMGNIASDLAIDVKMRTQAINVLGDMATHESLLILLNIAANDRLNVPERELALKRARDIVKKGI